MTLRGPRLGVVLVLSMFCLSAVSSTGATASPSSSSTPAGPPQVAIPPLSTGELAAASASLASGQGPAGGRSLSCPLSSTQGTITCRPLGLPNVSSASWRPGPTRFYALGGQMAYDPMDHYVLFLGYPSGTWIFHQNNWSRLAGEQSPFSECYFGLTTFTAGRGVLFFGQSVGPRCYPPSGNQTWLFTRGMWTHLNPLVSPPAQTSVNLVDDAADSSVVLLNDYSHNGDPCTTWLFSHGSWIHLCPSTSPTPRSWGAIVYDVKDHYVVLVGGYGCTSSLCLSVGVLHDTWRYSGRVWTQLTTPANLSSILWGAAVTYDAADGYVLVYASSWVYDPNCCNGSLHPYLLTGVTWKFTNGSWSPFNTSAPGVADFFIGYDGAAGRVMLFAKTCSGSVGWPGYSCHETWVYSGGNWTNLTARPPKDPGSAPLIMAYDWADKYVIAYHLYSQQTWSYRSGFWSPLGHSGLTPGYLWSMTFDSADGYVLGLSQGTWKFLHGTWSQISATNPGANWTGAGVTYDDHDRYVVMFGSGMWNYSKGVWTNITSVVPFGLTARQDPMLTNDSKDGYVLLFGGYNAALNINYNDSWKYSGGVWRNITTPVAPPAQYYPRPVMAYDPSLQVVVFVGEPRSGYSTETWTFARGVWKDISPNYSEIPPAATNSWGGLVFDGFDHYLMLGPLPTFEPYWIFGIPKLYVATVKEIGLPIGLNWSATFCSTSSPNIVGHFTGAQGSVLLPNGTFTVLVKAPSAFAPNHQPGFLVVSGAGRTIVVVFDRNYVVDFQEQGLTNGTSWAIDVGGVTKNNTQSNTTFILLNGSYGFTVGPVAGKSVAPASGMIVVSGSRVTILIRFS